MSERLGEELERALRGDRASLRVLVGELTPVIQARVARVLLRSATGRQAGRAVRQEVEDMTQEVFVSLLEDGGKALRSWAPERGASLKNFVGLLAERQAMSILRSGRRSPWPRELAEVPGDDAPSPVRLEQAIESREMLERLLERLKLALSPRGLELFYRLYVQEQSVETVMQSCDLSADAVYAWRSRLRRLVREVASDLSGGTAEGVIPRKSDSP
jgi:RNA polymerase sigma-70 factor (ECF subfamily)